MMSKKNPTMREDITEIKVNTATMTKGLEDLERTVDKGFERGERRFDSHSSRLRRLEWVVATVVGGGGVIGFFIRFLI